MMGIPFQVIIPEINESDVGNTPVEQVSEYLAIKKVNWVTKSLQPAQEVPWILGADTLITLNGKKYGKPSDLNQAVSFLQWKTS